MTKTNNVKDLALNDLDLDFDLDLDSMDDSILDFEDEIETKEEEVENLDNLLVDDEEEVEEDSLDDVLELEEDEEEEEIVVPAPKPQPTKTQTKVQKQPAKAFTASSTTKKGKTKVRKTVTDLSYSALFESVEAKVNKYDEIMEARAAGKTKEIPQSPVISKDLLIALLTARSNELVDGGLKLSVIKAMVSMGYDREEAIAEVQAYKFKRTEVDGIYTMINDVLYEIISAGSGIPLFKTEDCNATISGKWNAQRLSDNKHLNTNKASLIDSYLSVQVKSPAPANKKQLGTIKNGKFVPDKK